MFSSVQGDYFKVLSLCYLTLPKSILKTIVMKRPQKAEGVNLICMKLYFEANKNTCKAM